MGLIIMVYSLTRDNNEMACVESFCKEGKRWARFLVLSSVCVHVYVLSWQVSDLRFYFIYLMIKKVVR